MRTLIRVPESWTLIYAYPEFIQLMDDDIVSLTGLMLIVNPLCKEEDGHNDRITQLTLSLYLMTRCHIKLRLSVTSLAQTLDYIEDARRTCHPLTLDQLLLKLTEQKILSYISVNNDTM